MPVAAAVPAAASVLAAPAAHAADRYVLDASHRQILFFYDHLGYSTTWGMFSGFEGEILFDQANPAASSVTVEFPVSTMLTGWESRFQYFMSGDFFGGGDDSVRFASTGIEVTGDTTARITGDLTLKGVTQAVVLDARLNAAAPRPMEGKPWAGFSATTTLSRTACNLGMFAPFVGDEAAVQISVEAIKAD